MWKQANRSGYQAAGKKKNQHVMQTNFNQQLKDPGKLSLQTNNGKAFFLPGQIIRLEARSNYTKIYFTNHFSMVTAKVLKDFEPILIASGFIRTHRSHLINTQFIVEVLSNGTIVMNDRSTAGISKRRRAAVLKALHIISVRA